MSEHQRAQQSSMRDNLPGFGIRLPVLAGQRASCRHQVCLYPGYDLTCTVLSCGSKKMEIYTHASLITIHDQLFHHLNWQFISLSNFKTLLVLKREQIYTEACQYIINKKVVHYLSSSSSSS